MKVLIDNGHGEETAGKCSPDGKVREHAVTRQIAGELLELLKAGGIDAALVTPEIYDVPLRERVARVNGTCAAMGARNCLLISIHCNAAGNGLQWTTAQGWEVYVAPNASAASKSFGGIIAASAERRGYRVRKSTPAVGYRTGNFAIIRDTHCAAVLTENLFMDNTSDALKLRDPRVISELARVHYDAVIRFLNTPK